MSTRVWNYYGNEWAAELLSNQVRTNTMKQSYMFFGPDSVGKRTLALQFAKAILCPNSVHGTGCGKCPTCTKADQGQGFDLKLIQRIAGKADILIEQVREAEQFLRITPFASPKKIVIFTDFDLANNNTQNALLKTLEEAPTYAVIILLCQRQEMLLPTVLSRCEKIELRPAKLDVILEFLLGVGHTNVDLPLLAKISGGCPGYAWRLANDGEDVLRERSDAISTFFDLVSMPLYERFNFAETLQMKDRKAKEQAKAKVAAAKKNKGAGSESPAFEEESFEEGLAERWLLVWVSLMGDAVYISHGSESHCTNVDHIEQTTSFANKFGPETSLASYQFVEKALKQLRANGNSRMVFEVLLMNLPGL